MRGTSARRLTGASDDGFWRTEMTENDPLQSSSFSDSTPESCHSMFDLRGGRKRV